MSSSNGTVYLLHFSSPYRHAGHYLGFTAGELETRLVEHQTGAGANLVRVIINAGLSFELARTWRGGRRLERRIKTLGGARRVCPICTPGTRWGRFK